MAYVDVPDPLLDAGKPIRSTDIKQLRDNIRDHEERVNALEDPTQLFEHFHLDHDYTSGVVIDNAAAAGPQLYSGDRFVLHVNNGKMTEINNNSANDHYMRMENSAGGASQNALAGVPVIFFDGMTPPITFIVRMKFSTMTLSYMFVGLSDDAGISSGSRPTNGIYLEYVSATNWRFTSSRAGVNNAGTSFAHSISAGTWFEVKIIFMDDAGDHAECYIDEVLKEDLDNTALPTDKSVRGRVQMSLAAGQNVALDSFSLTSSGLTDSA